jgi:flagellar biosynthesis activator protein FlaF
VRIDILSGGLRDALTENQIFWGELKHDLAQPDNALSPDLRAGLMSLALWVDKQTAAVLGGKPGVAALVDVNRAIIAGLAAAPSATLPTPSEHSKAAQALHQGG